MFCSKQTTVIMYFSILLHWSITCAFSSVYNAAHFSFRRHQTYAQLTKMSVKMSLKYCNIFDQRIARQQLWKRGPTRNSRWGCVFYVVHAEQWWNNRVMQPIYKQWLCKHTLVAPATIETVFSVGSGQSAYKRSECSDSSRAVMSQS
jgi:hypothetical protein